MTRINPPIAGSTTPLDPAAIPSNVTPATVAATTALGENKAMPQTMAAGVRAATMLSELARAEGLDAPTLVANIRAAFGSISELSHAMRENHGALGDLLYCRSAGDLDHPERLAAVHDEISRIRAFDDALRTAKGQKRAAIDGSAGLDKLAVEARVKQASSDYIRDLKALAAEYHDKWLPAVRRNELLLALKNADFGAAVEYYEATAARWPAYANDDLGREYFVVANNKAAEKAVTALGKAISKGQAVEPKAIADASRLLRRSITEGKAYVAERSGEGVARNRPSHLVITPDAMPNFRLASSEIVAGVGKAFYVLRQLVGVLDAVPNGASKDSDFLREQLMLECRDLDGVLPADFDMKQAALEVSTRYYEAAYNGDFAYYPAMPSIYQNFELGNQARAEGLLELAHVSTQLAGGTHAKDFWCLQSQLEIALMRRDHATVIELMEPTLPLITEGWHIDTCANRMRGLAEQRATSEGESSNVQMLRFVADQFAERASSIYSGTASPQAEWNAAVIAGARAIAAITPAVVEPKTKLGRERADFIRNNSFSFRALTTSHSPGARLVVGGNYAHGGQIPDTEVTRTSRRHGLDILSKLKIDAETPRATAEERIRQFVDTAYGFVRDNDRVLEDLHGQVHQEELDPFAKHRFNVTRAKARGDDATELFTDLQMGIGDCRPSNWAGGYLMTMAQSLRISAALREAYYALPEASASKYILPHRIEADTAGLLTLAHHELEFDYRVVSWVVHADIAGKGPYDFERDASGALVPTADGKLIQKEDHTGTTLLRVGQDGAALSWTSKDVFYQWFYPLWNKPLPLETLDAVRTQQLDDAALTSTDKKGAIVAVMPMGNCMGVNASKPALNSKGAPMTYGLSFASYSNNMMRAHDPEASASHSGVTFAGAEVAPANPATMTYEGRPPNPLGERRRQLALDIAKRGLVTSTGA